MVELSEKQFAIIDEKISGYTWQYAALKEELFDHACCQIEQEMDQGKSFQDALQITFDTFNKNEVEKIQKETILLLNQKQTTMKKVSLVTLLIMLLISVTLWTKTADPPSIVPLLGNYKISSTFGERKHPLSKKIVFHKGIDIIAPHGTAVVAPAKGSILKVEENDPKLGKYIIVEHDEAFSTMYTHLSKISVSQGESVDQGAIIGAVGTTGLSTGPHLHYEVLKDGENVDPKDYLPLCMNKE